jgi:hypothetical protein
MRPLVLGGWSRAAWPIAGEQWLSQSAIAGERPVRVRGIDGLHRLVYAGTAGVTDEFLDRAKACGT